MELSKEILLLKDALMCEDFNINNLVKLIEDVCDGMDVLHSKNEKTFVKTKVCFYLLLTTLKQELESNLSIFFPSTWTTTLSWKSLFEISLKSCICDTLFDLAFTRLPKKDLSIFVKSYCSEMSLSKSFHDQVVSVCILTSIFLYDCNELVENDIDELMNVLMENCQLLDFDSLSKYHISGLQQAFELIESKESITFHDDSDYNLVHLKSLQQLSSIKLSNVSDMQDYSDLIETTCSFQKNENEQHSVEMISARMNKILKKLSIFLDKVVKDISSCGDTSTEIVTSYRNLISLYFTKIQTFCALSSQLSSKVELAQGDVVENQWNIESALLCVTNFLHNYDEAVKFLLDFITTSPLPLDVLNCLESLLSVPESLIQTCHVINLLKIIGNIAERVDQDENWLKCLKFASKLLDSVYQLLPLKSKVFLLKQRCIPGFLCFSNFKLNDNSKAFNQKINIVFNKLTKINTSSDYDDILHNVINVGFFNPNLTLVKIAGQVESHKEHHSLLVRLFQDLPCLLLMEGTQKDNLLLGCLIETIEKNGTENTINNVCDFISLILSNIVEDRNVMVYFTEQLLLLATQFLSNWHVYVSKSNATMMEFAFKAIQCISNEFNCVKLFDLFALVHILACIVDEGIGVLPDTLYSKVKLQLLNMVTVLSLRVTAEEEDSIKLCVWLKNLSRSFLWTTQLYLRPLLRICSDYYLSVPTSIQSICTIPSDERICFDADYGNGTGLTVWLQCLIVDPSLFSISSLKVSHLSIEDQQWFKHGLVVALAQVLPYCLEEDWHSVIEVAKSLLNQGYLYIGFPNSRIKTLPLLNLRRFRTSLCLVELLHCVNIILHSSCCASWMSTALWLRYTKCYASTVKHLIPTYDNKIANEDSAELLFLVSQLFFYASDFFLLLESISNTENACEFLHVLLLDLMTMFCNFNDLPPGKEGTFPCNWTQDFIALKSSITNVVSAIRNSHISSSLLKKLNSDS